MATVNADIAALDAQNTMVDQIVRASKVTLYTIAGPANLQTEIGTKGYILHALFSTQCPLVHAFSVKVVDHIDKNFGNFEY